MRDHGSVEKREAKNDIFFCLGRQLWKGGVEDFLE